MNINDIKNPEIRQFIEDNQNTSTSLGGFLAGLNILKCNLDKLAVQNSWEHIIDLELSDIINDIEYLNTEYSHLL